MYEHLLDCVQVSEGNATHSLRHCIFSPIAWYQITEMKFSSVTIESCT